MNGTTDAAYARRMLERAIALATKPTLGATDVDDLMTIAVTVSEFDGSDIYTAEGLNRAAATGWNWKAGLTSDQYDLGGGTGIVLDRSQWQAACERMARLYASGEHSVIGGGSTAKRSGIGSIGVTTEMGASYWGKPS